MTLSKKLSSRKTKFMTYDLTLKQKLTYHIVSFRKFCYTTIACAVLLYTLFFIFTSLLHVHYILSFVIAYPIAMSFAFMANKIWVFNSFNPKAISRQYVQFFYVYMATFIVNLILLYILVEFAGFWYLLAQLVIGIIITPLVFLVTKIVVFSHI